MKKLYLILPSLFTAFILAQVVYATQYPMTVYGEADGLSGTTVETISIDQGGYIWLTSSSPEMDQKSSIGILDQRGEFIEPYNTSDGLSSNNVTGVAFESIIEESYDDPEQGAVWIATDNGISILDRKGVFTNISSSNCPLPGNNIRTIFIDRENVKWISVWGKGICCVDSDFNWETYNRTDGLCSNYIISIKEDKSGNIWFGSKDKGVSRLDREGSWNHFSSANSGLIGNCVTSIAEEHPARLWFVTPDGISVFNGQNWTSYTSRNSPAGNYIPHTMLIDSSGNKWIGTRRGGLFKLNSFGIWTHFHSGNTSLPDNMIYDIEADSSGSLWIATAAGLCMFDNVPHARQSRLSENKLPASILPGNKTNNNYYSFEHALTWENIGETGIKSELTLALPTYSDSGKNWFCAAFWADHDFSFENLYYRIEGNRRGNMLLKISGHFSSADFLTSGGVLFSPKDIEVDKNMSHPFPDKYSDELNEYLMPGEKIPGENPEIIQLSQQLVKPDSHFSMYKTLRDIVYSKLIQNIGLEHRNTGLLSEQEPGEENAEIGPRDVSYVLNNNSGGLHSKARLICALARAAGIPARIVTSMTGSVWCQAWISNHGWVSVQASYPVYDYVRTERTYMPKSLSPAEHAVASVSGSDDDGGVVLWGTQTKAYYTKASILKLKNYRQISTAKLLLIKIAPDGKVPDNAMLQVDRDLFVTAQQTENSVLLVFRNGESREIKNVALSFAGLSCFMNIQDRFFWKFIPRRLGDILVIETIEEIHIQPSP